MQHPENIILLFCGIAEFFLVIFAVAIYFVKRLIENNVMKLLCGFLFGSSILLIIIIAFIGVSFLSVAV